MRKKIVFLLPSLGVGGAERVFINLCKHLDKGKYEIILCLLNKEGKLINEITEVPFKVVDLKVSRVRYSLIPIIKFLWVQKPDIFISTLGHLNALLGAFSFLFPNKTKKIARESNIVSQNNHNSITLFFYKFFYKNFDYIVVQSQDMANDLRKVCKNIKSNQIFTINNPIDQEKIKKLMTTSMALFNEEKINLLSVGSLSFQKGYDLLIKSFANFKCINKYHLTIIGEGELNSELLKLIEEYGISESVSLIGFKMNPYQYMAQADIFISSSRFEGFPNVVLESLVCNTPVLANDYLGGINEIILDPIYGAIINIENSALFEKTCEKIMLNTYIENELSDKINNRFGIKKMTKKYEDMFDSI